MTGPGPRSGPMQPWTGLGIFWLMSAKLKAICMAGLAVGVLDGLAAVISSALRGVSPGRVFQYIASGVLGKASYEMGAATVLLGIFLHFVVAFGASAVFVLAASRLNWLVLRPLVAGPIYGVLVYFFMGEVVSALSRTAKLPRTAAGTAVGILIHIFCVGLPIALLTSRYSARDIT